MGLKRSLLLTVLVALELAVLGAIIAVLQNASVLGGWNQPWFSRWNGRVEASGEGFIPLEQLKGTLIVHNDAGRVEVINASSGYGVHSTVYAYGENRTEAEANLALVEVSSASSPQGTRIEAKGPRSWAGQRPYADMRVIVPPGTPVEVHAAMGSVVLHDFSGNADIEAGMGRVDVNQARGNMVIRAKMGRIQLQQVVVQEICDIDATMGAIYFSGRMGQKNRFKANMGSITIELPSDHPALTLDAEWSLGSLKNSLPFIGESKEHHAQGVLGPGTPVGTLRIQSEMGSIRIKHQ